MSENILKNLEVDSEGILAKRLAEIIPGNQNSYKTPVSVALNKCHKLTKDFITWSESKNGKGYTLTLSTFIDDFGYSEDDVNEVYPLVARLYELTGRELVLPLVPPKVENETKQ